MNKMTKVALLIAALGVSACTNGDRFGTNGSATGIDNSAGAFGNGANTGITDPALNPTSPQYFSQTVGDRVLFEVDQSTLTAAGQTTLDGQAQWLLTNSDYLAVIEGHADEQGTREYNIALGSRRANSVREYLVSKGVPSSRIRVVSFGKERPAEICSQESCYAKNRRAVTVISIGTLS